MVEQRVNRACPVLTENSQVAGIVSEAECASARRNATFRRLGTGLPRRTRRETGTGGDARVVTDAR